MSAVISEDVTSRELTEKKNEGYFVRSMERIYTITGTDDPGTAADLGPQYADAYGDGSLDLYVVERRFTVLMVTPHPALRLVCRYGSEDELARDEGGDPETELGAMSETSHIQKALAQAHYPNTATGPDLCIGVDSDGKVAGVDIYVPKPTYKERRLYDNLDPSYWVMLTESAGKINSAGWKLWDAYEVLFLGAMANQRGRGRWRVEYNFAISLTVTKDYGGAIGSVTKPGWYYLWLEQAKAASADGTTIAYEPAAVHVAQVYDEMNFAALGLGV
jgi:hypothetical protein